MFMTKEYIREKLIDFQKRIADLSFSHTALQNEHMKWKLELYSDLFEVQDSLENMLKGLEEKETNPEQSSQNLIKGFRSIYMKILRLLSKRGIERIEFPENKAIFGLCKVIETRPMPGMENEQIIAIVRNGYMERGGDVIRPAEVITVLN